MSKEADFKLAMIVQAVPEHLRTGIVMYVFHGIRPGSFLQAMFAGDLFDAVDRADSVNREHIADIARFIFNYAPSSCFGSRDKVEAHIKLMYGKS